VMPESTVWYLNILSNGCAGGYLAGAVARNSSFVKVSCSLLMKSVERQLMQRNAAFESECLEILQIIVRYEESVDKSFQGGYLRGDASHINKTDNSFQGRHFGTGCALHLRNGRHSSTQGAR
jgi:hypothetical protein